MARKLKKGSNAVKAFKPSRKTCVKGFEPSTFWSVARRSIQLSYTHLMTLRLCYHTPTLSSTSVKQPFVLFLRSFYHVIGVLDIRHLNTVFFCHVEKISAQAVDFRPSFGIYVLKR